MANLTSLNKLTNTRVFVAVENGSPVEALELVTRIPPKDGDLRCQHLVSDFCRCYIALLRFFGKEKGKNTVTLLNRSFLILPRIQHKVVLPVLRTVFAVGF